MAKGHLPHRCAPINTSSSTIANTYLPTKTVIPTHGTSYWSPSPINAKCCSTSKPSFKLFLLFKISCQPITHIQ